MALYENIAKVRKLVGVRRVKRWIPPGEQVDLDSTDARHLGGNAAFMRLTKNIKKKDDKKSADEKAPSKKTTSDKPDKQQIETDRKALNESLRGMTKVRIIEVAEGVVGMDVLSRDKKDALIKKVMNAAKEKGYRYVLENS